MDFPKLISIENLFQAWGEFRKGKGAKRDVQIFERHLEDNLFILHNRLKSKTYRHGNYREFYVTDPKRRHIHKASVFDRIVHHLLYKYLYELFDKCFIYDSYSCRVDKGTHRAVRRLEEFTRIASKNYTQNCWVLKLDIKKFFESVDHDILFDLISKRVRDKNILWIIKQVIDSFHSKRQEARGIPLGNLTSQIFANIYLNELDRFVKHSLNTRYYLRYADDFIILDSDTRHLKFYLEFIRGFLQNSLKLELHPQKIALRKLSWGIDFCGYIVLPHYKLVRTKTRRRIFKKVLVREVSSQSLQSYLGYFSHSNSYKIIQNFKNIFWLKIDNSDLEMV